MRFNAGRRFHPPSQPVFAALAQGTQGYSMLGRLFAYFNVQLPCSSQFCYLNGSFILLGREIGIISLWCIWRPRAAKVARNAEERMLICVARCGLNGLTVALSARTGVG